MLKADLILDVETKGGMFEDAIKPTERAKIDCGIKHFESINSGVSFVLAESYERLEEKMQEKVNRVRVSISSNIEY